jgi:hypothetical protein
MSPLVKPPFCIIQRGKQKSRDLAQAVIDGCGGGTICNGDIPATMIPENCTPVFIGVHPTTVKTLHEVRAQRRPFVTVDNGYFRPYKEGGYFRATTNALQWVASDFHGTRPGRTPVDPAIGKARWDALGIEIEPWDPFAKEKDKPFLIALQSPVWLEMMGEIADHWLKEVLWRLKDVKARAVIREKPLKGGPAQPPLAEQLADCSGVIAYSSNVMLKALVAGVPVFPQAPCAASPLGKSTLWQVHNPTRPPREPIFHDLAANQWTVEEIASGRMWADLQSRYVPEFPVLS